MIWCLGRGVRMGTFAEVVISLAGPVAGFCFGAVVAVVGLLVGAKLHLTFHTLVIPSLTAYIPTGDPDSSDYMRNYYCNLVLNDLLFVNIYWGLINLLPVYPLDGGHVSKALFEHRNPARGRRRALMVSAIAAVTIALFGLITRSMYLMVMFGVLAAGSAQMLEAERPLFRPSQSRR